MSPQIERQIDEAGSVRLSIVSTWEISIKLGLGKLKLDRPLASLIGPDLILKSIEILSITESDILAYSTLSFPDGEHRDPFDRMLIVQAAERALTLLTADASLATYGSFVKLV